MKTLVPLFLLLGVLLPATPAEARRVDARFMLDVAPGVAIPVADGPYRAAFGPSFKLSSRFGAEFWFTRHFGIAGEADLDLSPLMVDVTPIEARARVRGLVGFRLLFGFRVGAFFIRQAMGVDWIGGSVPRAGIASGVAALGVEPGFGMYFRFIRHGVAGFAVDFPVGFFNFPSYAADVQMLGFLGLRI